MSSHTWTEREFLALGEAPERVELFDGSLLVTPAPTPRHQHISTELSFAFRQATRKAGLYVHEAVNVRLQSGRIPIPDVVITSGIDFDELVIDAAAVLLVCEIVSPSNASADKVLKLHYYAAAGIPWYLLIEQETGALHLYQLTEKHYVEHSVTPFGETLHLREPVVVDIDTTELLPPR
ncbi:Uma2 family endonuclease [Actinoplanes sp. NPDC051494]|uniref:Uma2 family endonuclease n=1 Tax=Actinoplanes sp. NPDC051494 TaxID=3363907 RepID=UPI00379C6012